MESAMLIRSVFLLVVFGQVTCDHGRIALFVTDVQKCFTSGGTLAVDGADVIIDVINNIRKDYGEYFDVVVHSQDWHCTNHVSFASQYPNHGVYDNIQLNYDGQGRLCKKPEITANYTFDCVDGSIKHTIPQTLWPDHCIKNTPDAQFHPELMRLESDIVIRKGYHCQIDSYSMFYDNGEFSHTDLVDVMRDEGVDTIFMTGLALDYCVLWTAREAVQKFNYRTYVIEDATRPVDVYTGEAAKDEMTELGITLLYSDQVGEELKKLKSAAAWTCDHSSLSLILILSSFSLFYH